VSDLPYLLGRSSFGASEGPRPGLIFPVLPGFLNVPPADVLSLGLSEDLSKSIRRASEPAEGLLKALLTGLFGPSPNNFSGRVFKEAVRSRFIPGLLEEESMEDFTGRSTFLDVSSRRFRLFFIGIMLLKMGCKGTEITGKIGFVFQFAFNL
jgi:hypothetical protein